MDWIEGNIIRPIFFSIDSIIYGLISILYELLMYLANLNIFGYQIDDGMFSLGSNGDIISDFTQRIYVLLGIFMLFKVSFSILQYLVDPDSFSDKSKGMGKLITNVLVALVLLVLTPTLFGFAYKVQAVILNNNVIPKLILGNSAGDYVDSNEKNGETKANNINVTLAEDMKFLVFGSFFTVNTDLVEECAKTKNTPVLGTKAMAGNEPCVKKLNEIIIKETGGSVSLNDFFRTTNDGSDKRNFKAFAALNSLTKDDEFYFDYKFGITTAAGIFIVIMLLSYCIAVAVRVIKLFFLQIIAPIPIVSYVDPRQGKDGTMMKWAKECGKTYASLFIRIALIFLSFYLIDLVASLNLANGSNYYNGDNPEGMMSVLVTVMLIFGILIFANQVPKLLEEIFGFKFTGEYTVNPLKSIKSSPLASMATGGAIGFAGGAATNLANSVFKLAKGVKGHNLGQQFTGVKAGEFKNATGFDKFKIGARGVKNFASNTLGTVAGGTLSGAVRSGMASKKGDFKEGIKKGHDQVISKREARDARQQQSVATRFTNKATQFAGAKNEFGTTGQMDANIKNLQERLQQNAQIQEQFREQYAKQVMNITSSNSGKLYEDIRKIDFDAIDDYNKYLDAIRGVGPTTLELKGVALTQTEFEELRNMNVNIKGTVQAEKDIKKAIKDYQRAGGIKGEENK